MRLRRNVGTAPLRSECTYSEAKSISLAKVPSREPYRLDPPAPLLELKVPSPFVNHLPRVAPRRVPVGARAVQERVLKSRPEPAGNTPSHDGRCSMTGLTQPLAPNPARVLALPPVRVDRLGAKWR
jgi:hypothetical protein